MVRVRAIDTTDLGFVHAYAYRVFKRMTKEEAMQVNFQVREIANGIVVGYSHPYETYGPEGANGREKYFKDFTEFLENSAGVILDAWAFHKQREQEQAEREKAGYMAKGAAVLGQPLYDPNGTGMSAVEREPSLNEQRQADRLEQLQEQGVQHWRDKVAKHVDADDFDNEKAGEG